MNNQSHFRLILLVMLAIYFVLGMTAGGFAQESAQTTEQPAAQTTEQPAVEVAQTPSRVDIWQTAIRPDYSEIDKYVKECGGNCGKTPEEVAEKITATCTSDLEKARAIFDWLAYNIAYDTSYSTYSSAAAFKKKKSVCNGYAELFQTMGEHVGLNTFFVSGDAKNNTNYTPSSSITSGRPGGHAWNIVKLEDREILLDATWGAGYVSGNRFTRDFAPWWFDVHPAVAIFTHFPNKYSYQLLEPTISFYLFKQLPYIVPSLGYCGLNPSEVLKFFLENPESEPLNHYNTLNEVIKAGLKFEKLPLTKYLRANEEYEIRYRPSGKLALLSDDARSVENADGTISLFLTGKSGNSIHIQGTTTKSYSVLKYSFVDKEIPFSKRKPLKIAMPRTIRFPESIYMVSEFVQTGSNVIDGFFINNTESYVKDVSNFLANSDKYFFHPEQATLLKKRIDKNPSYAPVSGFTTEQCVAYANYMSNKEKLSPCYSFDETGKITINKSANGYRIPTLTEWLYAATNGTMQMPQDEETLAECSWFEWNSAGFVHNIADGKPNAFGLYDMFGNTREIVFDEETGIYCAIGGTADDDFNEIVSLNKHKVENNDLLDGSIRFVRSVPDDAQLITNQATQFLNGDYVTKDYKKAFDWYSVGAKKGNSDAFNSLGVLYAKGEYIKQDYKVAFDYCLKAANMGNKVACFNIGLFYENGWGIDSDQEQAFTWYKKAADLGHPDSMYKLSKYYYVGMCVPKDLEKRFEYLEMANDNGISDLVAITDIASCYELGLGTEIDLSLAYKYFIRAAQGGSVLGMNRVADFNYEAIGMSMPDYYEAKDWYKKAAEKGNQYAEVQLSKMYYYGFWYDRNIDFAFEKVHKVINDGYELADDYYAELLQVKELLDSYGENKKLLLSIIPDSQSILEYLEPFNTIDSLSEKLSGTKIANPFIFNGLKSEELQAKVIDFLQMASENKEFPSECNVLLMILPENWQNSHPIVKSACTDSVFTSNQRRMNGERYKFDKSLFAYYDAIIPININSIDNYMQNLASSIKGCKRTDMLLLGETLFESSSVKGATASSGTAINKTASVVAVNSETDSVATANNETASVAIVQDYKTYIHDIWRSQIDLGILPRLIAIGDKTDEIQKNINLMFESDGTEYAEKINVFGTPLVMTKEISLGFRNENLLVCMLTKTFANKKAFRIYLDETGVAQGETAKLPTFIPDTKFYTSMKKGVYDKIACIKKPGKMVMDYAVVKPN